jgi:hypothetical protein
MGRCPSLKTLSGRIWQQAVVELTKKAPTLEDLVAWLPPDLLWGRAGAAASFFGNIVEVTGSGLKVWC